MDIEFTSAAPDLANILIRYRVPLFGDDLKRSLDSVGIVQVHQFGGEVATHGCFHVVRHDQATGCALRPKPNKRDFCGTACLHPKPQTFLVKVVHCEVYWPGRERQLLPIPEISSLQVTAQRSRQKLSDRVI